MKAGAEAIFPPGTVIAEAAEKLLRTLNRGSATPARRRSSRLHSAGSEPSWPAANQARPIDLRQELTMPGRVRIPCPRVWRWRLRDRSALVAAFGARARPTSPAPIASSPARPSSISPTASRRPRRCGRASARPRFSPAADPKTKEPYTIAKDGFRTTFYEMVGQYGTHVDPPAHFAENGITMDKIPLKQMILPLIVLDDTPYLAKDPNHAFSVADLTAWEKKHGRVPKGSFVALRTDMSKDFDRDPERFKRSPFPAWSFETIKFLYEQRGVTATGHESLDTDTTDKMESET